jgi:hypothetical protein
VDAVFAAWVLVALSFALLGGTIAAAFRLQPSQLRRLSHSGRRGRITLFCALLSCALAVGALWAWLVSPASDPAIGRTQADVIGTWTGEYDIPNARLHVFANNTFTATGLPPDTDDPAGNGQPQPASGHGTWQVNGEDKVTFILSGGSTFTLMMGDPTSPAAASGNFQYQFDQFAGLDIYSFAKQQGTAS